MSRTFSRVEQVARAKTEVKAFRIYSLAESRGVCHIGEYFGCCTNKFGITVITLSSNRLEHLCHKHHIRGKSSNEPGYDGVWPRPLIAAYSIGQKISNLGGISSSSLPVESSLIFQPSSIACNAPNFLTIEIRDGIVCTCTTWVDSVLLYPLKKSLLFHGEFWQSATMKKSPYCISESWANEPAEESCTESRKAHTYKGIGRYNRLNCIGQIRDLGEGYYCGRS